jgi:hypothetical protein
LLQNITQGIGFGWILWNDLGYGNWIGDLEQRMLRLLQGRFAGNSSKQIGAKYNLDAIAVQAVIWDKGGSQPADDYIFSMEM